MRRAIGLVAALALIAGCNRDAELKAIIDATQAYCDANPVPAFPPPVRAASVYVGAGALTQSWLYWIPKQLLQGGFTTVESAASIAPNVAGHGKYLRFRIAPASTASCAGQHELAPGTDESEWKTLQRNMADLGLRADQCLTAERIAERMSPYWLEVWDASASLEKPAIGLPIERTRVRYQLIEAASGRVMHEHVSEHGFVQVSMSAPFGCLRRQEWAQFTDGIVIGEKAGAASAPAPETVENPLPVTVQSQVPVVESTRDLGRATIDYQSLEQRRARTREATVEGFEVLEGTSTDRHETNPGWPRYLQLVVDGQYRRVRLAWLEGDPHGAHDRPVRLFDLGDRIGLFAVTRGLAPGTRGTIDLSWAEFSRATGSPVLRADTLIRIEDASDVTFQSIVENVQRSADGVRFTVTEISAAAGEEPTLLRETTYLWPLASSP